MEQIMILFDHPAFLVITALTIAIVAYLLFKKETGPGKMNGCCNSVPEPEPRNNMLKFIPISILILLLLLFLIFKLDKQILSLLLAHGQQDRFVRKYRHLVFLIPVILEFVHLFGTKIICILIIKKNKTAKKIKAIGEMVEEISRVLLIIVFIIYFFLLLLYNFL